MKQENLEQRTESPRIWRESYAGLPYLNIERRFLDEALYKGLAPIAWLTKFVGAAYAGFSAFNDNFKIAAISTGVALGAHFLEKLIDHRDDIIYGKHIKEFKKKHPNWYKD